MSENRQMAVVGHLDALRVNTAQGLIAREVGGIAEFHNHLESDLRMTEDVGAQLRAAQVKGASE